MHTKNLKQMGTSRSPLHRSVFACSLNNCCFLSVKKFCSREPSDCPRLDQTWAEERCNPCSRNEPAVEEIVDAVPDPKAYNEIVFYSYGETSIRLYDMLAAACELRARGAKVRLNTDGYANAVYRRDVTPDLEDNIDALTVSLIAQDAVTYNQYCRPHIDNAYETMLDFTRQAREFVPDITLSAINGLPGVDIEACRRIADDLGVKFSSQPFNIVQYISQI